MTVGRRTPPDTAEPGQFPVTASAIGDSVDGILRAWAVPRPGLDFSPVGVVARLERSGYWPTWTAAWPRFSPDGSCPRRISS